MRSGVFVLVVLVACGGSGDGDPVGNGAPSLGANDRPRFWGASVTPDGRFVALGEDIAFSDDGITWDAAGITPPGSLRAIAYGPDRWITVGAYDQLVSDDDGATWTPIVIEQNPIVEPARITDIGYRDGTFVAVGTYSSCLIFTSTDGVSWSDPPRYVSSEEPRLFDDPVRGWLVYDKHSDITVPLDLPFEPTSQPYYRGGFEAHGVVGSFEGVTIGFARNALETVLIALTGEAWQVTEREDLPSMRATAGGGFDVVAATDGLYRGREQAGDLTFEPVESSTSWMAVAHRGDEWIAVGDGIAYSDDGGATWSLVLE